MKIINIINWQAKRFNNGQYYFFSLYLSMALIKVHPI